MLLTRSTYYWLWFMIFGVISAAATLLQIHRLGSEDILLLAASFMGIIVGTKSCDQGWVKPYDLSIGIFFFIVGVIGILRAFNISLVNSSSVVPSFLLAPTKLFGLSLLLHPAVLHAALGFLSLRYGLKNPAMTSNLEVASTSK